jgi:Asp-tRNA(Asn)/Glu-tRNA(Gln) amidotransferase A subunit family amidase
VGTLGNLIDTVEMPNDFALAEDALGSILCCGIAHSLHGDFVQGGKLMSDRLTRVIERGQGLSAADFLEACRVRDRLRKEYDVLAMHYDAIVTLAAPGAAPLFTEGSGNPIFSTIWTLVGAPAITLPLFQNAEGMPIGVQLVGRLRGDAGLLSVAAWLERSCGGFAKRFERADVDA